MSQKDDKTVFHPQHGWMTPAEADRIAREKMARGADGLGFVRGAIREELDKMLPKQTLPTANVGVPIVNEPDGNENIVIRTLDLKLPKEVPLRQGVDGPVIGRCINLRIKDGRVVGDMQMFAEPVKEWKTSTFRDVLRHAASHSIGGSGESKAIETSLLKHCGGSLGGVDLVFFSDGTAVASEGAHTRQVGSEYTPEEETEPAKWWIYS